MLKPSLTWVYHFSVSERFVVLGTFPSSFCRTWIDDVDGKVNSLPQVPGYVP